MARILGQEEVSESSRVDLNLLGPKGPARHCWNPRTLSASNAKQRGDGIMDGEWRHFFQGIIDAAQQFERILWKILRKDESAPDYYRNISRFQEIIPPANCINASVNWLISELKNDLEVRDVVSIIIHLENCQSSLHADLLTWFSSQKSEIDEDAFFDLAERCILSIHNIMSQILPGVLYLAKKYHTHLSTWNAATTVFDRHSRQLDPLEGEARLAFQSLFTTSDKKVTDQMKISNGSQPLKDQSALEFSNLDSYNAYLALLM
jgi:hypothetical protein